MRGLRPSSRARPLTPTLSPTQRGGEGVRGTRLLSLSLSLLPLWSPRPVCGERVRVRGLLRFARRPAPRHAPAPPARLRRSRPCARPGQAAASRQAIRGPAPATGRGGRGPAPDRPAPARSVPAAARADRTAGASCAAKVRCSRAATRSPADLSASAEVVQHLRLGAPARRPAGPAADPGARAPRRPGSARPDRASRAPGAHRPAPRLLPPPPARPAIGPGAAGPRPTPPTRVANVDRTAVAALNTVTSSRQIRACRHDRSPRPTPAAPPAAASTGARTRPGPTNRLASAASAADGGQRQAQRGQIEVAIGAQVGQWHPAEMRQIRHQREQPAQADPGAAPAEVHRRHGQPDDQQPARPSPAPCRPRSAAASGYSGARPTGSRNCPMPCRNASAARGQHPQQIAVLRRDLGGAADQAAPPTAHQRQAKAAAAGHQQRQHGPARAAAPGPATPATPPAAATARPGRSPWPARPAATPAAAASSRPGRAGPTNHSASNTKNAASRSSR